MIIILALCIVALLAPWVRAWAKGRRAELADMTKAAKYWEEQHDQQVEIIIKLSPDAQKWRLAREARIRRDTNRTAAERQRVVERADELRGSA